MYSPFIPTHDFTMTIAFIGNYNLFLQNIYENIDLNEEIVNLSISTCRFTFYLTKTNFSKFNNTIDIYFYFNDFDTCNIYYNNSDHFEKITQSDMNNKEFCKNIFDTYVSYFVCENTQNIKEIKVKNPKLKNIKPSCKLLFRKFCKEFGCLQ